MHVAVTGGTGRVGRFIVDDLRAAGHQVTLLGRTPPVPGAFPGTNFLRWSLDAPDSGVPEAEALVHCAFDHLPGRYRGGEGGDAEGFRRRNLDGSVLLFEAAARAGCRRAVFISSRAVYGDAGGERDLHETDPAQPNTLYGVVKLAVEAELPALSDRGVAVAAIRATGVFGLCPGWPDHKWGGLFADYLRGQPIVPRVGTELHGSDLAAAARRLLTAPRALVAGRVFNASDLVLDHHDLLSRLQALTKAPFPPPSRSDATRLRPMNCTRLHALGWRPTGALRLARELPEMAHRADRDCNRR